MEPAFLFLTTAAAATAAAAVGVIHALGFYPVAVILRLIHAESYASRIRGSRDNVSGSSIGRIGRLERLGQNPSQRGYLDQMGLIRLRPIENLRRRSERPEIKELLRELLCHCRYNRGV